eukprot:Skav220362  [mRNA]  locus=scaffold609:94605:98895:- [translate_table: standard]
MKFSASCLASPMSSSKASLTSARRSSLSLSGTSPKKVGTSLSNSISVLSIDGLFTSTMTKSICAWDGRRASPMKASAVFGSENRKSDAGQCS